MGHGHTLHHHTISTLEATAPRIKPFWKQQSGANKNKMLFQITTSKFATHQCYFNFSQAASNHKYICSHGLASFFTSSSGQVHILSLFPPYSRRKSFFPKNSNKAALLHKLLLWNKHWCNIILLRFSPLIPLLLYMCALYPH